MRVIIKYHLVLDLLGINPNGEVPESFNSVQEAENYWAENFRDRNKNDGYDDAWRKTPLRIKQVITSYLWELN